MSTISEGLRFEGGIVTVEVIRDTPEGPKVIQRSQCHNLVVNVGKKKLIQKAIGTVTKYWRYFRIGTCGVAANSAQTNLISPITGTVKTLDTYTISGATRTFNFAYSYPSGAGTKSATGIKEVILGDQHTSPGGSICMRAVLSPAVNKSTSDKLKIVYKLRIT